MKTAIRSAATLLVFGTAAFAAGDANSGMSVLTMLFLGFGALILVFQFVPAMALFGSMLYGLFSAPRPEKLSGERREKSI